MTSALQISNKPRLPTADAFFALPEDTTAGKKQRVAGEVVAMSPASGTHIVSQGNVTGVVYAAQGSGNGSCRVGTQAPIRPRLDPDKINVRVPEIAVTCLPSTHDKAFPDPVLIVEVLSPRNEEETNDAIFAGTILAT